MGNLPILWVLGILAIGYAVACARSAFERQSKIAWVQITVAAAAASLLAARIMHEIPLTVYLLGELVCAIASFHFDYIGRSNGDSE